MRSLFRTILAIGLLGLLVVSPALGGGLLPDRDNRVLRQGRCAQPQPAFLLVFSAQPLRGGRGQPLTTLSDAQATALASHKDQVVLRIYGKSATRPGQFEYSFG